MGCCYPSPLKYRIITAVQEDNGRFHFTIKNVAPYFGTDKILTLEEDASKRIIRHIRDFSRVYLIDYTKIREMDPNGFWKKRRVVTSIKCVNRKKVTITVLNVESIDENWNRLTLKDSILNIRNRVISWKREIDSIGVYEVQWSVTTNRYLRVVPCMVDRIHHPTSQG